MKALLALLLIITGSVASAGNTREDVEITFDRNKGGIYALYRQALKDNPNIKGKIVLEFVIATSGTVSSCRVKSSQLGNPVLEGKLCDRVMQMKFMPRPAPETITKPIDFFPG